MGSPDHPLPSGITLAPLSYMDPPHLLPTPVSSVTPPHGTTGVTPSSDGPPLPDPLSLRSSLPTQAPGTSDDPHATPRSATMEDSVPFLWLMDLYSSIIENSVQATWGVSSLAVVARFLHDPANCNMARCSPGPPGSPARFNLHIAPSTRPQSPTTVSALEILAADYGLKARSASGIRGDEVEDWPILSDPSDLALLHSHISHLQALPGLGSEVRDLLTEALLETAPGDGMLPLQGTTLLAIGDPRLPYSLFEPPPHRLDGRANTLPLRFTGDPASHAHATTHGLTCF